MCHAGSADPTVLDRNTPPLKTAQGVNDASAKLLMQGRATIKSPLEVEADLSGNCDRPVTIQHHGRPSHNALGAVVSVNRYLTMTVPCRKCPKCLRRRQWHWTMRAKSELGSCERTWFGTLTLRPDEQFMALSRARSRARTRGVHFEEMTEADQFRAIDQQIAPDLQKWLKRLRRMTGAKIRYVIVSERHKSGHPHYHVLIHQQRGVVAERDLRGEWKLGFSKFNLVPTDDPRAAHYVCKYLGKDIAAKVRASLSYGTLFHDPPLVITK